MPTYEFKCENCGHQFSEFTSVKERDNVKCPKCGSKNIKQIYGGFLHKIVEKINSCNFG